MSKILELREKRNKIWNAAKEFLDQKRGADGLVPPKQPQSTTKWKPTWSRSARK